MGAHPLAGDYFSKKAFSEAPSPSWASSSGGAQLLSASASRLCSQTFIADLLKSAAIFVWRLCRNTTDLPDVVLSEIEGICLKHLRKQIRRSYPERAEGPRMTF
jgi:hypothetical protein